MSDALPAISRRTFISVSTLAGVATAAPLAASTIAWSGPLAIASQRSAIPAGWQGSATVLAGDYFQRLGQIRIALATSVGRKLALFLDGADEALFDIALIDRRATLRPVVLPAGGVA
ncbi:MULTISPECIES: hypothetical protein [Novosphingobium]|uniref:Uncharacterized protein n=1 Tax=Novosphingobium subterraneum TaxID=48936 RepID=A0A0B9AFL6_9SPHN|nr:MULTISPECIES: hypothetical protein [Novosphingobium]KHS48090.1 hypothetical protein NJ75_01278 [Novosphingobium subterraneum]QOV94471.1 hypothetical protein IM701_03075 [Novosphingobium sp. ES2-1]